MRITNIIAVVCFTAAAAAFFTFLFYPYAELSSMQAKRDIAVTCLYVTIAGLIGLAVTACCDARN